MSERIFTKVSFDTLDKNGDAQLDTTEISVEFILLIESMDGDSSNDDRKVAFAEWIAIEIEERKEWESQKQGDAERDAVDLDLLDEEWARDHPDAALMDKHGAESIEEARQQEAEEMARREQCFDALDADGNGVLDTTEVPSEFIALHEAADGNSGNDDGKLTASEYGSKVFADASFDALDKNSDGKLDTTEVPQKLIALVEAADGDTGNANGALSLVEFRNFTPTQPPVSFHSRVVFDALDKNSDGKLDATEVSSEFIELAEKADGDHSNDDGLLTLLEFRRHGMALV